MTRQRLVRRGVSLIEAVVALAVLAFGMLGVAGLQGTLRGNADGARQRTEALRIAQSRIETRRSFSTLPAGGGIAYAGIVDRSAVTVDGKNATFTIVEEVTDVGGATDPRRKALTVQVSWADRTGVAQTVQLATVIAGMAPEHAAVVTVPATSTAVQLSRGRHAGVPRAAVDQGDGTSRFVPPGAPADTAWVFSNISGWIVETCTLGTCTPAELQLLSGFVRFAALGGEPSTSEARNPTGVRIPGVIVAVTLTDPVAIVACYIDEPIGQNYTEYFCALPVNAGSKLWSGRSELTGLGPLATNISDVTAGPLRVCRYTTLRNNAAQVPPLPNAEHPYNYAAVVGSLANQNFLVMSGGDNITAFACPDDPATPPTGRTWHHQPAS